MRFSLIYFFLLPVFWGCNGSERQIKGGETRDATIVNLAKRFNISVWRHAHVVSVFGNRHTADTTAVFVVANDTIGLRLHFKKACIIKSPCRRIAALSSIYASMFYELGALNNLAAIDNADYILNPAILERHLPELAKEPKVNIEKTVSTAPDIIFTFGMGEGDKDIDKKLKQTGIPVAISVDHLEESPLARAEWIKFFAVFTGKLHAADSIFKTVESNYIRLKGLAQEVGFKPTVFSETKYSDFWYMPGGRSYVARLLNDAGANYLWSHNNDFGSLPLSFEQVYANARDADFWINLSTFKTKKELLASENRYAEFKAFKTGSLYNNNRYTNKDGYSSYWETGMIHPDRILSDLIHIFHPYLKAQISSEFFYYKHLD